jgi:hypothetical protein
MNCIVILRLVIGECFTHKSYSAQQILNFSLLFVGLKIVIHLLKKNYPFQMNTEIYIDKTKNSCLWLHIEKESAFFFQLFKHV